GAKKGGRRAPRGQRREQFLAALEKSPGAKASEIAKQLGISANQAHTLARRLHKDRLIRRSGKGYRLIAKAHS
ncbi:MAG TPA: MarR family transcriptional regulator, partial [Solirubrobacterales bacterium]|nr:MarR family transcriptional regulator [Solirubrobacterales bacterium]